MASKRYYWIKLKDSFLTSEKVDFLMSQPNGAEYVVLYQMLCLKAINNGGELASRIGEIIIPYDVAKIQRDTRHFKVDTVRVALEIYKKLGLIYEQESGILKIADFDNLVGGETVWAEKKRKYRLKEKQDKVTDNVLPVVRQEIRDKSIEYRDKDIKEKDIDKNKEKKCNKKTTTRFIVPAIKEIEAYCKKRSNGIKAEAFFDYYQSKGWMIGKNKMKDWRAAVRTWERRDENNNKKTEIKIDTPDFSQWQPPEE